MLPRPGLIAEAAKLQRAIAGGREPQLVADFADELAARLRTAYPIPLAPTNTPDFGRGAT